MNQDFPIAKVPLTPLLDSLFQNCSTNLHSPSVLNIKNKVQTTSGRAALALAFKDIDLKASDEVLIPAFHCEAMVAPAKWLNARVVFYQINKDTQINIDDIKNKITPNTKAILATHYFGFLQDLDELRLICDEGKIVLIEDCAHAFFGESLRHHKPVGTLGDYSIASSMKFFPIYEGGLLCSEKRNLKNLKLTAPNLGFQIKAFIDILEKSILYKRLGLTGKLLKAIIDLKTLLWTSMKKIRKNTAPKIGPGSSEGGFGLDPDWVYKSNSLISKWLINASPLEAITSLRRKNYNKLHQALSNLPNSYPLFSDLPDKTIPFVYPLYVNDAKNCFIKLKQQGIPIWRFGEFLDPEVTQETCPVSVEYSKHIFQFPCHQSLTEQEIDWMITQISETLRDTI